MSNAPPLGRPGPSVQDIFARDPVAPPPLMLVESPATGLGTEDVSIERYFTKDWHDCEVTKVWRKTWQFSCRIEDIPNTGDHIVYEIVHDSLIVVRTGDGRIKALVSSCLHRGTMLRTERGCVNQFKCPFHGFT